MARAADRAYEALRTRILDGGYVPGARLGEAELAETTGTSRTPVREALRRLEVEGLVEVLPHRGARVAEWSKEDMEEIYDLRMMLETLAAQRAATRISAARLGELGDLCDRMEALVGVDPELDKLAELNAEFHGTVREAARSTRLVSMLNAVVQLPLVMSTFHRYSPGDLRRSAAHHRELVDALRARDETWAGSVMRSHVAAAKSVLLHTELDNAESEE